MCTWRYLMTWIWFTIVILTENMFLMFTSWTWIWKEMKMWHLLSVTNFTKKIKIQGSTYRDVWTFARNFQLQEQLSYLKAILASCFFFTTRLIQMALCLKILYSVSLIPTSNLIFHLWDMSFLRVILMDTICKTMLLILSQQE